MKVTTLVFILTFVGLMARATESLSDSDYCRNKLGCLNWKQEFHRCRKVCTANASSLKSDFLGVWAWKLLPKSKQKSG